MHIDMRKIPGVDMSTGSLGHGLPVAVGMALADRVQKKDRRVFCVMGDAEQNEGSIWEAAQAASHFQLGHLCAIVDRNRYSSEGDTEEILAIEPLHEKYTAFGWNVHRLDGHSIPALLDAFAKLPASERAKPTAIIADTVKGKGVSFMEAGATWHYGALSEEDEAKAIAEIRGASAR
jgi:transketolase